MCLLWDHAPELILLRLPTGCSFSSTAPAWLCTVGPILQEWTAAAQVHVGSSSPSPPLQTPLYGLQLQPDTAPAGAVHGLYFLHTIYCDTEGSSMAAHGNLHGAHGLQVDNLFLHGPLLCRKELLLSVWSASCPPSELTLVAAGWFLSCFLTHSSFSLSQICCARGTRSVAHCSALSVASPLGSSWSWLWSDMGYCWTLLTEAPLQII